MGLSWLPLEEWTLDRGSAGSPRCSRWVALKTAALCPHSAPDLAVLLTTRALLIFWVHPAHSSTPLFTLAGCTLLAHPPPRPPSSSAASPGRYLLCFGTRTQHRDFSFLHTGPRPLAVHLSSCERRRYRAVSCDPSSFCALVPTCAWQPQIRGSTTRETEKKERLKSGARTKEEETRGLSGRVTDPSTAPPLPFVFTGEQPYASGSEGCYYLLDSSTVSDPEDLNNPSAQKASRSARRSTT